MKKTLDLLLGDGAARFNALRDAGMVQVDNTGATLRRVFCARADLSQLGLIGTEWDACELSDIDFSGADLTNAWVHGGRFERCHFVGATLTGVVFEDVDLVECDFTGARGLETLDWSGARLQDLPQGGAGLSGLAAAENAAATPSFVAGRVAAHPEWEAKLDEDPDDGQVWQVYGDWLLAQGDLRGELVARQRTARTEREFAQFVDEHLDEVFGPCADEVRGGGQVPELQPEWRNGFVVGATLRADNAERRVDLAALAARVLALPVCRFLRRLSFGVDAPVGGDEASDYSRVIEVLRTHPRAAALTHLEFGLQPRFYDPTYGDYERLVDFGDLSAVWALVPQLRTLRVLGGGGQLGQLTLPELRTFVLQNDSLEDVDAMRELLDAQWPKLERLELTDVRGALDVPALLERCAHLPLSHLAVLESPALDEVLAALIGSPVLPRLRVLDLRAGALTAGGVALLTANVDAFSHLERLDLSGSLENANLGDLARLGSFLVFDQQLEVEVDRSDAGLGDDGDPEDGWDFAANAPLEDEECDAPLDPRADLDIPDEHGDG